MSWSSPGTCSTTTSITQTFGSSRVMEEEEEDDSYRPHTSILGPSEGERTDCWRKCSADTTHDISELELDSEITDLARQDRQGRQGRKQACTLL